MGHAQLHAGLLGRELGVGEKSFAKQPQVVNEQLADGEALI
jgi:hypothetical protein